MAPSGGRGGTRLKVEVICIFVFLLAHQLTQVRSGSLGLSLLIDQRNEWWARATPDLNNMSHKMRSAETRPDVFKIDPPWKSESCWWNEVKLGRGLDSAVSASELVRQARVRQEPTRSTFFSQLEHVATAKRNKPDSLQSQNQILTLICPEQSQGGKGE